MHESAVLRKVHDDLLCVIDRAVDAENRRNPAYAAFSDDFSPAEFEAFCAHRLIGVGWNARVTRQSRDQGVDVIAEKDGMRLAIQCKLYRGSIGNKAVQEIVAARAHEGADRGIAVSNSRYTAAAHQLARTNAVLVLHYRDLDEIDAVLRRGAAG